MRSWKQPWRWQGRPLPLWPGAVWARGDQGTTSGEIEDWELAAFAGLDDLFDTEPVNVGYVPLQSVNAPLSASIYTDDWSHKTPISRYVRYALRAHSRYAGLFAQRRQPTITRTNESRSICWRSAFLRYAGPTPSLPVIRAIVPLTEPAGDSGALDLVAPLLVVVDEQAFDRCGITEALECQVIAEDVTMSDSPIAKPHLQYGHDPIIDTTVDPRHFARTKPVSMRVEGPFGYTFDTDARQPLFVASSYLIRPPELDGIRAWDFAKVRFRRLAEGRPSTLIPARHLTPPTRTPRSGLVLSGSSSRRRGASTSHGRISRCAGWAIRSRSPRRPESGAISRATRPGSFIMCW